MTGRNVKKQRDDAMRLLREGLDVNSVLGKDDYEWRRKTISFLSRFEGEEQKKQAHAQRNGVKK